MKLVDHNAQFVRYDAATHDTRIPVDVLGDAQGLQFLCPCKAHYIETTFDDKGAAALQGSQNRDHRPIRWSVAGTGLDDLTLDGPITGDCGIQIWIENGAIIGADETS
jgi:hypothetical protein